MKITAIISAILIIFLFGFLFYLNSIEEKTSQEEKIEQKREKELERFEVLDHFRTSEIRPNSHGKILKHKKTGECFLYIWAGVSNGGPAITSISCDYQ